MTNERTGDYFRDENGDPIDQVDCDRTMRCGGCPWKNDLGQSAGAVYGMMGTSCWYRGKYGAYLLDAAGIEAERLWGDDQQMVRPDVCREIAYEMTAYGAINSADPVEDGPFVLMVDGEDVAEQFWYLRDWLLWVADKCEGAVAWY
ncbi:MAG: hypothetical protein ACO3RX_01595 [Chthoniobacterales bacterium]